MLCSVSALGQSGYGYGTTVTNKSNLTFKTVTPLKCTALQFMLPESDTTDWEGFVRSKVTRDQFEYTAKHYRVMCDKCCEINDVSVHNPITKKEIYYTFDEFRDLVWLRITLTKGSFLKIIDNE